MGNLLKSCLAIAIIFGFIRSCDLQDNFFSSSKTEYPPIASEKSIADRINGVVGKFDTVYRADTKYTLDDGSYIITNIHSIKRSNFKTNTGIELTDVLVIEIGSDLGQLRSFITQAGFFVLYDSEGKEETSIDISTQSSDDNGYAIMIIEAEDPDIIRESRFLSIGGFDVSTVGSNEIIFRVQ